MNIQIVIPAHNEEAHLGQTLASLVAQTLRPKKIIVVNDASTDATKEIINDFSQTHPFISAVNSHATSDHQPGSKVIRAFYAGLEKIDPTYDVVCKFDADLIFPANYLETIAKTFQQDSKIGMCGGFCYVESDGAWKLENLTNKDHIRGALKAYRRECFDAIGGLKKSIGWDTVDELLAQYHGWKVVTDENLHVKHLKPTGATYTKAAKHKQGEAFYKMRYGWGLTQIAAIKLATRKGSIRFYYDCMRGFIEAKKKKIPYLVSEKEGEFIRSHRWKGIKEKLF